MAPDGSSLTQQSTSMSEPVDVEEDLNIHHTLSSAVQARKPEFTRRHRIRIKVGSWNVAACPGTDKDLASWFIDGRGLEPRFDTHLAEEGLNAAGTQEDTGSDGQETADGSQDETYSVNREEGSASEPRASTENANGGSHQKPEHSVRIVGGSDIGLYVLGLQEIISLNIIAGYSDTSATAKWQAALEAAMPPNYKLVASQQLSGLLLLIYASPDVAPMVSDVSTVSVGTGLLGYMGNKGGVSTRLVLGESTTLVFTDCHLASGHDQTNLERRWWDYNRILTQTQFSPLQDGQGGKIGDEDFAFWFGDLNFRLDGLPGGDIRRLLMLHTRGEYDLAKKTDAKSLSDEDGVIVMHGTDGADGTNTPATMSREASFDDEAELPDPDDFVPDPHDDPASLQATLDSLLPHDQLARSIQDRKAFHEGWREGTITFLPSYKYDVGTVGLFDSSEKQRAPSWCDRILYRTRADMAAYKAKIAEEEEARKKDEDMKKRGIDTAADDESVLFEYDPERDASESSTNGNDSAYDYDEYDEADEEGEDHNGVILTKDGYQDHLRLDLYTTHQRITSSDHKPIVALFTLDYDAVVPELKARVHAEVARELDRAENEGRPAITIIVDGKEGNRGTEEKHVNDGSDGVDCGDVGFLRPSTRFLTIANTGGVSAKLNFMEKPRIRDDDASDNARGPGSEWLSVSLRPSPDSSVQEPDEDPEAPQEVVLEPGETATATITISVSTLAQLQSLNAADMVLEDVLVLRVVDGRDHFLPVRASWIPSCFGRSIEELIRVPPHVGGMCGFVKKLQQDTKNGTKTVGRIPDSLDVHSSSPPELYKLTAAIEALAERAVADENMLEEEDAKIPRDRPGWPFISSASSKLDPGELDAHRAAVIEALETEDPSNVLEALPRTELTNLAKLEIVAEVLLLFLRSLTDGIVTTDLFAKIEDELPSLGSTSLSKPADEAQNDKDAILDILSQAPYHSISFAFITGMLAKLASEINPLASKDLEALSSNPKNIGKVKRTLTFRRRGSSLSSRESVDEAAIQKRVAWEHQVAELFGPAVCRPSLAAVAAATGTSATAKDNPRGRKAADDKAKALVELFLRRRDGG